ncbi:hypothetical protein [Hymenobacter chitinivorans]|uniref:Uncharacterized protein n=1 Tax=Hymenobacter chitinivorans DSM 11115 TaxID=1121954 RepID=A0A2M9BT42_9BACT|nr:hypothetical protein [Hymenobacter chitinivorans]PJJ61101.1 hypothetical protein CLV45_2539 [Hymenobacter chitinivorans DSM 11115]
MQPFPAPVALPPLQTSRTFQVQSDTSTRVRAQTVSNSITTTLRQTYYGRSPAGSTALLVEQLGFAQTDQSPLAVLLADLNPVNNQLLFEVGTYGDLLAIRNLEQVREQWLGLKPQIMHTYGSTPEGEAFIQGFEQQLASPTLLDSFRNKGGYGILFPGLFSPVGPAEAVRAGYSERLMVGFFGSIDLPLRLHTEVVTSNSVPSEYQLRVTGELDAARFDEPGLQGLVKQAMDMLNFRVTHSLNCKEEYTLDENGWLTAARQELTFTIENFYHQHIQHELKLA